MIPDPDKGYRLAHSAIDEMCQLVAFGNDLDLILLARELVAKQAARRMVLKIEVIPGDSAGMAGYAEIDQKRCSGRSRRRFLQPDLWLIYRSFARLNLRMPPTIAYAGMFAFS